MEARRDQKRETHIATVIGGWAMRRHDRSYPEATETTTNRLRSQRIDRIHLGSGMILGDRDEFHQEHGGDKQIGLAG